ncbi:MAG: hypothetical protein ACU841_13775 [Gammaproteobacteria bacterium]
MTNGLARSTRLLHVAVELDEDVGIDSNPVRAKLENIDALKAC